MTLEELKETGLICERVIQNLSSMGIEELFPVQIAVIPYIIAGNVTGGNYMHIVVLDSLSVCHYRFCSL
jgi:superfamily II DNA/RNA helicase